MIATSTSSILIALAFMFIGWVARGWYDAKSTEFRAWLDLKFKKV